jgi:hypothetical protein
MSNGKGNETRIVIRLMVTSFVAKDATAKRNGYRNRRTSDVSFISRRFYAW